MSISAWWICFMIYTVQTSAWQYCSDSRQPSPCVPCQDTTTHKYKCPRQCGNQRDLKSCTDACSNGCVASECEYDITGTLHCIHGCKPGLYGTTCDRKCDHCKNEKCDINGSCIVGCKPGYFGRNCDKVCDKCRKCETGDCEVCGKTDGRCLLGCTDGYYGSACDIQCQARCSRCHVETGLCQQCVDGWFGKNCQHKCHNCINNLCSRESGQCSEGCEKGFELQGTSCQKIVAQANEKDPEKKKAMAGLFDDQDYLLPVVGCLLVLVAVIAVVIFWRCRKTKAKENEKAADVEEGKCNGLTPHPSLRRSSTASTATPPLYQDLVEEAIRTHSCEEILKKHNLLDPDKPRVFQAADKSLASLRNRTGNLSMPFMTPIEEDEEEVEEVEDDGVHMPNVGIIFTLEPPSDDDACDDHTSVYAKLTASQEDNSSLSERDKSTVLAKDESESSTDNALSTDPSGDIYILQRGTPSTTGGRAISLDYLDTSHSSGRSTPKVPDMYVNNPHEGDNHFSTMLSNHLDTYLTDRSNPDTVPTENGSEVAVSESDALLGKVKLQNNNNQDVSKSRNINKLKPRAITFGPLVENSDADTEMEPMLSNNAESNA